MSSAETRRGATPLQLKDDIDSGRTGDKVAMFDPGAAPFGTDEEAAGTPTPALALAEDRREKLRIGATVRAAERASRTGWRLPFMALAAALLVVVAALLLRALE